MRRGSAWLAFAVLVGALMEVRPREGDPRTPTAKGGAAVYAAHAMTPPITATSTPMNRHRRGDRFAHHSKTERSRDGRIMNRMTPAANMMMPNVIMSHVIRQSRAAKRKTTPRTTVVGNDSNQHHYSLVQKISLGNTRVIDGT